MTVIADTTTAMPIAVPSSIQSATRIAMPTSSPAKSTKPVVHKKKKTWKKPADKPKRPLSAYNLFFQHERNRIVGDSPAGADGNKRKHRKSHGKIGFESLAKTIADKWKTLDKASKRPFEQQAKREKAIYAKKLQAWHELRLARPSLEQILEQAYIVRPSPPPATAQQQPNMAPSPVTSTNQVTPTPVTPPAQPQAATQQVQLQQLPKPMPVQSITPIAIKKLAAPDIMDLSNPKAFFEKTSLPVAPMDMSLTNLLGQGATGGDVSVLDSFDMPEIGAPSDDLSQMLNDDFIDFLSTMD